VEAVLAWEDIQRFKAMKKEKRKQAALDFLDNYLKLGAPMELNTSDIQKTRLELLEKIQNSTEIETNLFDSVQTECVLNMTDVLTRMREKNQYIDSLLKEN